MGNALLAGLPYLVMWLVSMTSSILIDYLIAKNYIPTTLARKIANSVATVGPALALLGASFAGCDPILAMALLTLAVGSNGMIYSGEQSAMLDISNNFAGTIMGIINALGNTMGFLAPMVTGLIITTQHLVGRYSFGLLQEFMFLETQSLSSLEPQEQKWNRIQNRSS